MTFSLQRLLRTGCLSLARLLFLWPALLTGAVMLVMAFLSYQGASHRDWIITHMRLPAGATRRKGALWCGAASMPLRTMPYSLLHR